MRLADLKNSPPNFSSAKIALIHDHQILVYERDNFPYIPYPGFIDLPGGGRENNETAFSCIIREVNEEFGILLSPANISYVSLYPSGQHKGKLSVFFAGSISPEMISAINFGNEGHSWRMMPMRDFLSNPNVVPAYVARTKTYLKANSQRKP